MLCLRMIVHDSVLHVHDRCASAQAKQPTTKNAKAQTRIKRNKQRNCYDAVVCGWLMVLSVFVNVEWSANSDKREPKLMRTLFRLCAWQAHFHFPRKNLDLDKHVRLQLGCGCDLNCLICAWRCFVHFSFFPKNFLLSLSVLRSLFYYHGHAMRVYFLSICGIFIAPARVCVELWSL
jgi:hypothetical protein